MRSGNRNSLRKNILRVGIAALAVAAVVFIVIRVLGPRVASVFVLLKTTSTALPLSGVDVTSAPSPESAARAFLDAWRSEDYPRMYSMLSSLSRDAMSEEAFTGKYTDVRDQATLRSIDYRILSADMSPTDATVSFEVTLHTILAGDITRQTRMLLRNQSGQWKVAWNDTVILPELGNGNYLMMHRDWPTRGNIYDRNGLALAAEGDAVEIGVVPGLITDEETMLTYLSRALGMPREMIRQKYANAQPDWYIPIGDVNRADIEDLIGTLNNLGGIRLTTTKMRYYYEGGVGSHIVGYTQKQDAEMQAYYRSLGYDGSETVGANGLERWGEQYLAGKPGGQLLVLSAGGSLLATLGESEPQPSMNIHTTIDRELQARIEQTVMGNYYRGAVVVLQRDTGEVLAMTSSPRYDSNLFNPESYNGSFQNGALVQDILNDPNHPLINRATSGLYPLGSVFKIITMAAALESGLFTPDSSYFCTGEFTEWPGLTLYDWTIEHDMKPHGTIDLVQGLTRSCDCFFWHVGLALYYQNAWLVPDMAYSFGLGKPTGIIGMDEEAGLVPNPGWKHDTTGEDWNGGDALNQAIGQGMLQVTPLQVADFIAAVGNGGTLWTPQVVSSIEPPIGDPIVFPNTIRGKLPVKAENLAAIQKGMIGVVNNTNGTAHHRFYGISTAYKIAGKTGTAQTNYEYPHSWFAAYTYSELPNKPDIAVVVVAEYAGEGADAAAPMVRRVIELYFLGQPASFYPWESEYGWRGTNTPEFTPTPSEETTETLSP
jgi:penicillin-binding protein 2